MRQAIVRDKSAYKLVHSYQLAVSFGILRVNYSLLWLGSVSLSCNLAYILLKFVAEEKLGI